MTVNEVSTFCISKRPSRGVTLSIILFKYKGFLRLSYACTILASDYIKILRHEVFSFRLEGTQRSCVSV